MTRITGADHVLLLLRAHLDRTAKRGRKERKGGSARARPLERLRQIAGAADLPRQVIGRALIEGLLIEEFGDAAINDAPFQALVDEVRDHILRDDAARRLLDEAVDTLRRREG